MVKNEVAAYVIMESTSDPVKPKNLKVFNKNNLFYLRFETTLQGFNVKNRNNRIYMGEAMIPSLQAEHIMELQRKGSWFGEAGHPDTDEMRRILTIDPKLISHKIASHEVTRSFCKGTIETLDNDGYGRQMTKNILQGMEPAFSLRALAPLTKMGDGSSVVKGKSHCVTYDWVILPSHRDAYRDQSKPVEKIVKKIEEDGNTIKESVISKVTESTLLDFIAMESTNVKLISNVCEVAMEGMAISKDLKHVILKENNTTYMVNIEDQIKKDISHYIRNI